ncbi:MAG: KTSC domain-containing protein [Blastocatellia bacterium]
MPESIYAGLMSASSKGRYFNSRLKNRPSHKIK